MKVVYQVGVNEKLLGDFIRKHNVRDKLFSELSVFVAWKDMKLIIYSLQSRRNVASKSSRETTRSPILHRISRITSRAPSKDSALLLICTICIG